MKTPTLRQKVIVYEDVLHQINMLAEVTLDQEKLSQLITKICRWSYAHRQGNGELSEKEQQDLVNRAFYNLR